MKEILINIDTIKQRINKACLENSRNPNEVKLLLVTKTVSAERIKIALQAGHTLIAENKVQEIKQKSEPLQEIPHTNHFMGICRRTKSKIF